MVCHLSPMHDVPPVPGGRREDPTSERIHDR